MVLLIVLAVAFIILVLSSIRQVNEYQKGIKFVRGRYKKTLNSGWHIIWPIFESIKKIDIRTKIIDVP